MREEILGLTVVKMNEGDVQARAQLAIYARTCLFSRPLLWPRHLNTARS